MAKPNKCDAPVLVYIVDRSTCIFVSDKGHPIEWYAKHVQEKAYMLLAACDEWGVARVPGLGCVSKYSNDSPSSIIYIYV